MPKTFLVRKRACVRREWHSKQTENKPASWTEDDVNSIRQTEEREKPITLYSNCDVGDSEGSVLNLELDNHQLQPLSNVQTVSRSPLRADKADDGENATEPTLQHLLRHTNLAVASRLHQTDLRNAIAKKPELVALNFSKSKDTHNSSIAALPKSPFLPQISPSLPSGSKSFPEHLSSIYPIPLGHQLPGVLNKCSVSSVSHLTSGTDQQLSRSNIDTTSTSALPSVIRDTTYLNKTNIDRLSDKRALVAGEFSELEQKDASSTKSMHYLDLKPIFGGRMEVINGGYGIKNPLLSPDIHIQPVTVDENITGEEFQDARLTCKICGKYFEFPKLLQRHLKAHCEVKRYLCTFCGKGFNDTFDLKRHTRTHTGVRPYRCDMCDKAFTQRCSLESHCRKIHSVEYKFAYKERREKVYVCEECGHVTHDPEEHFVHIKDSHPYSSALLRCYDKRQFKFGEPRSEIPV